MGIVKKMIQRIGMSPPRREPLMEGIRRGSRAFCGPEQLHIDLTNRCNLNCIACWHRSPLLEKEGIHPHWDAGHEIPPEMVLDLVDSASGMGVKKIIYSGGGDSLLYGDIFRVLEHTSRNGLEILLVSNLTMANKETVRRIIESGVNQLLVNLWAGSPAVYVATHPGTSEQTFLRVLEMLRTFVKLRRGPRDPELIISNVICARNYRDIGNMVRLAIDIGACDIWFQVVDVESRSMKGLLLSKTQIDELLADLRAVKKRYEPVLTAYQKDILGFDDFVEKLTNSRAPEGIYHTDIRDTMPCYVGWAGCRILANGDVVPCCKGDRHPLGNIFRDRFPEIWFSPRYNEFREKAKLLSKTDPYFEKINCGKMCDNWWFNKVINERYQNFIKIISEG